MKVDDVDRTVAMLINLFFHSKKDEGGLIIYYFNEERQLDNPHGPSIIQKNGRKEWYRKGVLHREDGPAIEYSDGNGEYWINDVFVKYHRWAP